MFATEAAVQHVVRAKASGDHNFNACGQRYGFMDDFAIPAGCMGLQQSFLAIFPEAKQADVTSFFRLYGAAVTSCAKAMNVDVWIAA